HCDFPSIGVIEAVDFQQIALAVCGRRRRAVAALGWDHFPSPIAQGHSARAPEGRYAASARSSLAGLRSKARYLAQRGLTLSFSSTVWSASQPTLPRIVGTPFRVVTS